MRYPYPVQYFFCTQYEIGDMTAFMGEKLKDSAEFGALLGEVQGETGLPGLKLDFNYGLRLQVPEGNWHVRIGDADSERVFYDRDVSATVLISIEVYYIRWQIDVSKDGAPVFSHTFDCAGQKVFFIHRTTAVGDSLALFPYIKEFQRERQADVYYYVADIFQPLFQRLYSDLSQKPRMEEGTYATYVLSPGIADQAYSPLDGRVMPLWQSGQILLDLPRPVLYKDVGTWKPSPRVIQEPYVCIGVQGSAIRKGWLYPGGWEQVVDALKELGYRVFCIDKDPVMKTTEGVMRMPANAEDCTGNRPLEERAEMLSHAEFFIGVSSGLAWIAQTVGCPVVMISGITYYWHEFPTPYRVFNRLVCNGCFNDVHSDFIDQGCKFSADSGRRMECSTAITPSMVLAVIDRLLRDKQKGGQA